MRPAFSFELDGTPRGAVAVQGRALRGQLRADGLSFFWRRGVHDAVAALGNVFLVAFAGDEGYIAVVRGFRATAELRPVRD